MQEAKLTISRTTSTHAEDCVTVEIKVGKKRHRFIMSLENYALAVTGMSHINGEYEEFTVGGS